MEADIDNQPVDDRHHFDQLALEHIEETSSINPSTVPQQRGLAEHREEILNKIKKIKPEVRKSEKGVEDNPEYYRVDFELAHKLYEIYRRLKIGIQEAGSFTFEQKQESNVTMNYHKIMEMLKDAQVKLEINQKLTLLRSIKKFSFNHNFISKEEFTKIFKVIVHGLAVKEAVFRPLVKAKYTSLIEKQSNNLLRRPVSIKLNKNFGVKLKTEPAAKPLKAKTKTAEQQVNEASKSIETIEQSFYKKNIKKRTNFTEEESIISTARRPNNKKRIATDVSRYEPPERGYLNRAIQKNKLSVISWDSLFKMNENTLNPNISIPSFISKDIKLDDIYL